MKRGHKRLSEANQTDLAFHLHCDLLILMIIIAVASHWALSVWVRCCETERVWVRSEASWHTQSSGGGHLLWKSTRVAEWPSEHPSDHPSTSHIILITLIILLACSFTFSPLTVTLLDDKYKLFPFFFLQLTSSHHLFASFIFESLNVVPLFFPMKSYTAHLG